MSDLALPCHCIAPRMYFHRLVPATTLLTIPFHPFLLWTCRFIGGHPDSIVGQVVNRIIKIRDSNPNTTTAATIHTTDTQRLNAHDIANRITRKENYMIAMFNKELLNLSPPLPFLHGKYRPDTNSRMEPWILHTRICL